MDSWHIWVVVGIGFFVAEIFTPGFVAANIGLGCLAGAVAAYFDFNFTVQAAVFALANLVCFIILRPVMMKTLYARDGAAAFGAGSLVGREGKVTDRIEPDQPGRVKIDGQDWRAAGSAERTLEAGTKVRVSAVNGITLNVDPVEAPATEEKK